MKKFLKKYHMSHLLFIGLTPIVAIGGVIHSWDTVTWPTWILFGAMMFLCGLAITGGYHRLFSHRAYQAAWPIRLFYLLFGAAAFQGSLRDWASQHRLHHRYVDTNKDPYNIKRGFWYAHVGWVVLNRDFILDHANIADLDKDRLIVWQHKYYIPIAVAISFILPAVIGSLWGNTWEALLIAGFARVVINHHFTFFINSYCHFFGRQTYSDQTTARDSGFIALFTYGEGYHSFHHTFEADYRNGYRFYQWDPTKWFILLCNKVGLARNLKRVQDHRILAAKWEMDQKLLRARVRGAKYPEAFSVKMHQVIDGARMRLEESHRRLENLKQEYQKLKANKVEKVKMRVDDLKLEMKIAQQEFHRALSRWKELMSKPQLVAI